MESWLLALAARIWVKDYHSLYRAHIPQGWQKEPHLSTKSFGPAAPALGFKEMVIVIEAC